MLGTFIVILTCL